MADVDAYIAAAPVAVQPQLRKLRAMIRAEAPQATEKISYGIPFYEYGDKPNTFQSRLIYFAAQKNHIAVYPAGEAQGLKQDLTERSTLRFPMDKPLPRGRSGRWSGLASGSGTPALSPDRSCQPCARLSVSALYRAIHRQRDHQERFFLHVWVSRA